MEHDQLFQTMREQHVPKFDIDLLRATCSSQSGVLHGSKPFDNHSGSKYGDVRSQISDTQML